MITITAEFVHSLKPCGDYPLPRLRQLLPEPVPLDSAIKNDAVPVADRVWLLCQPGVLSDVQRQAWLEMIMRRAITANVLHCGVKAVEQWARQWLSGEDRSEAAAWAAGDAAWAAAGDAAWAAARDAAWDAARDAAWDAARATAWSARDAARDAAWAAAWAARDAEANQQISDAVAVLRLEVDGG